MLDNPRSRRIKELTRLRQKEARSETGLFLLEGPQAVREALVSRPELIIDLFLTEDAEIRHEDLVTLAGSSGVAWETATDRVIDALSDTRTPQGVVAVCRQFPASVRDVFSPEAHPALVAILEEVRDPGNLGTIIRAADAAGADAVVLTGRSVDLYNAKVVRSTTGSLFHIPVAMGGELVGVVQRARAAGLWIAAADIRGEDFTVLRSSGVLSRPTAWIFGNEARGLPPESVALADASVSLPLYGGAESLNLATAAAVFLYESAFSQHDAA